MPWCGSSSENYTGLRGGPVVKNLPASAGDTSLIPGPGRFHFLVLSCESHSVVSNSLQHLGLYSPRNSPGQNTGVSSLSFLQRIFPEIKPRSHPLQADTLSAKPQRKPKNRGVGSLCLLQQIFPTQESNGVDCRQILKDQLNLHAVEPVLWNESLKMGFRKNVYINPVDLKKLHNMHSTSDSSEKLFK